jgi:hypothetical protein
MKKVLFLISYIMVIKDNSNNCNEKMAIKTTLITFLVLSLVAFRGNPKAKTYAPYAQWDFFFRSTAFFSFF